MRWLCYLSLVVLVSCKQPPNGPVVETKTYAMPTPPVRHVAAKEIDLSAVIRPPPIPTRTPNGRDKRWNCRVSPAWQISVDKTVMLYERTRGRYETVERMRRNGVPAPVIFCLHYRESSNSFKAHLHEGSSLLGRTRYVPIGRLPDKPPPYQWEESAEDAIYVADKLQGPWSDLTWSLNRIRDYNGRGYDRLGVPNPYLLSGTTLYQRGKFVRDGRYSSTAVDQQLGCVAILKRMEERGIGFLK